MTLKHKSISCVADEISANAYTIEGITVIAYNRQDAEDTLSDWKAGKLKIETQPINELPLE